MNKHTKKALFASILSLLLCVSMLVGTTFAWFTDTVTTGVNTIQSGTLDVVLEYSVDGGTTWEDAEGGVLNFLAKDGREEILWEPGCTYELPKLRVRNNGNLALKYQIAINGLSGDVKLLEAIEFTATVDGAPYASLEDMALALTEKPLLPADEGDSADEIVIRGHMKEEAGNEYQNLTIDGISITVYATQYTYETDSYDDQYDKDAFYADVYVTTAEELREALTAPGGGIIGLMNDIEIDADDTIVVDNAATPFMRGNTDKVLDLNGKTLSGVTDKTDGNRNMFDVQGNLTVRNGTVTLKHTGDNMAWNNSTNVFNVTAGGVLNIEDATVKNLGGSDMAFVVHMNNYGEVTLNVNDSTLFSTYCAVRVFNAGPDMNNVTITNSELLAGSRALWVHLYTAADFGNDAAKAVAAADRLNINVLAEDVDTENTLNNVANLNSDAKNTVLGSVSYGFTDRVIYYTTSSVVAESNDELKTALSEAVEGDTILLNEGEYTISLAKVADGVVIEGNGATVVPAEGSDKALTGTLQGVTVKDVTFEGPTGARQTYLNGDVVFENCTFKATSTYAYHTDSGSGTLTFNNCTFYGWVSYGSSLTSATFNNCQLYGNGKYATVRAWCDTVMNDCYIDHSDANLEDDYSEGILAQGKATVTLNNCSQAVANESGLVNALENGGDVSLTEDVAVEEQITVSGTLNGNGQTLDLSNANGGYDKDLVIDGGRIENITIVNGSYAMGNNSTTEDIYLDNVTVYDCTYVINGGVADGATASVYFTNSYLCGWLSYADLELFSFENCTLTGNDNSAYGIGYLAVYSDTAFKNCVFDNFFMAGRDESEGATVGSTVTLTDCYYTVDGENVKVTAANFAELFEADDDATDWGKLKDNFTVIVDGVTVAF